MRDADKIILHLCADIGSDTKKYKDAGYKVICIGKEYGVENLRIKETGLSNVYGIIANPVCTDLKDCVYSTKKEAERKRLVWNKIFRKESM